MLLAIPKGLRIRFFQRGNWVNSSGLLPGRVSFPAPALQKKITMASEAKLKRIEARNERKMERIENRQERKMSKTLTKQQKNQLIAQTEMTAYQNGIDPVHNDFLQVAGTVGNTYFENLPDAIGQLGKVVPFLTGTAPMGGIGGGLGKLLGAGDSEGGTSSSSFPWWILLLGGAAFFLLKK